jgi:hypothetical protein
VLAAGANILNIDTLLYNLDRLREFNTVTHRWTPKRAGYYAIIANIEAQLAAGAPLACSGSITRNGMTLAVQNETFTANGKNFTSQPWTILYVTPLQWIDVRMQGFAAPNIVTVVASNTQVHIWKIR